MTGDAVLIDSAIRHTDASIRSLIHHLTFASAALSSSNQFVCVSLRFLVVVTDSKTAEPPGYTYVRSMSVVLIITIDSFCNFRSNGVGHTYSFSHDAKTTVFV